MLNSTFDKAPNLLKLFGDWMCVCVGGGGGGGVDRTRVSRLYK